MPTWGDILAEIQRQAAERGGLPDWDIVRRKYLAQLHALTGRNTVLYSTDWLSGRFQSGTGIILEDMQGMMEVCRGLQGPNLDIILHSPGGSAEATASIVRYLRSKFSNIRVFVPLAAMSAATMWSLAADEIVMGKHSQLGPIDPQLLTPQGFYVPARAIIDQFERAKEECADDPKVVAAWIPILQQYGPALIEQCEVAEKLSRQLVRQWLQQYMFKGEAKRKASAKANRVAGYFARHATHLSHSIGIDRDQARSKGVKVNNLEADENLQDAVLSVHHATLHTFNGQALKIIENHLGRTYAKIVSIANVRTVKRPAPGAPPTPAPPPSESAAPVDLPQP